MSNWSHLPFFGHSSRPTASQEKYISLPLAENSSTSPSIEVYERQGGRGSWRTRVLYSLVVVGAVMCGGLGSRLGGLAQPPATPISTRPIVIRTGGFTSEGIGSAVQHFKYSILLAELMDRELVLSEMSSVHNYSLSHPFNQAAIQQHVQIQIPMCVAYDHLLPDDLHYILASSCNSPEAEARSRERLAEVYKGCGTIIHVVGYNAELNEQLNGCTAPWVKQAMLGPVCGRKTPDKPTGVTRVGVHFRWGDVATDDPSHPDWTRTMSYANINKVIASIEKCGQPMAIRVFAEDFPEEARSRFEFTHELVDSGNDIDDLCELSNNDVIVAGGSSFAVLAAQMSYARLAIVSDQGSYKYDGWKRDDFEPMSLRKWSSTDICPYLT